jgi:diaminohydroxyphosphoribosylaminopyrimidine deaminase / 5-amino-6-(5-phosphoribosylamino)uracil reductase
MDLEAAIRRANELSLLGLGKTSPNPIVGALILDSDGNLIAEGFHQRGATGTPGLHAEIVALQHAGEKARGATLVLTLEPCNHQGKTPPCTDAIIAAGISRVVFAIDDPNPVASGGAEKLRQAGIEVISGVNRELVVFTNRAWIHKITKSRPYITAKIAATLDGFIAATDHTSQWITSEASRHDVANLRSQCDAIVTGVGTVLADDPLLTARVPGVVDQPVRIVLGEREIPRSAKILGPEARTHVMKTRNLEDFIRFCRDEEFNRVLLEAGPTLTRAFLQASLIDEIYLYQAPAFLGAGKTMIGDLGITSIDQKLQFELHSVTSIGEGSERNSRIHLLVKAGR